MMGGVAGATALDLFSVDWKTVATEVGSVTASRRTVTTANFCGLLRSCHFFFILENEFLNFEKVVSGSWFDELSEIIGIRCIVKRFCE